MACQREKRLRIVRGGKNLTTNHTDNTDLRRIAKIARIARIAKIENRTLARIAEARIED